MSTAGIVSSVFATPPMVARRTIPISGSLMESTTNGTAIASMRGVPTPGMMPRIAEATPASTAPQ